MKTKVSARFQTVIPTEMRKKFNITSKSQLEWIDAGKVLIVVPVPEDPIALVRGMFKGRSLSKSLSDSREEERGIGKKGKG